MFTIEHLPTLLLVSTQHQVCKESALVWSFFFHRSLAVRTQSDYFITLWFMLAATSCRFMTVKESSYGSRVFWEFCFQVKFGSKEITPYLKTDFSPWKKFNDTPLLLGYSFQGSPCRCVHSLICSLIWHDNWQRQLKADSACIGSQFVVVCHGRAWVWL